MPRLAETCLMPTVTATCSMPSDSPPPHAIDGGIDRVRGPTLLSAMIMGPRGHHALAVLSTYLSPFRLPSSSDPTQFSKSARTASLMARLTADSQRPLGAACGAVPMQDRSDESTKRGRHMCAVVACWGAAGTITRYCTAACPRRPRKPFWLRQAQATLLRPPARAPRTPRFVSLRRRRPAP